MYVPLVNDSSGNILSSRAPARGVAIFQSGAKDTGDCHVAALLAMTRRTGKMIRNGYILLTLLLTLSMAQATETGVVPHNQLPEEVEQYNKMVETLDDLKKRLEALELKVMALENSKSTPSEGARTPAEAEATKKAAENAPSLADSPALAQYNQAHSLLRTGELDKAKEAFLFITREYPDDPYTDKAWLHIGNIHLKMKNFGEADKAFSEALTGNLEKSSMIDARLALAEAKLKKEETEGCHQQLAIVQKEQLSPEQKKRLEALKSAAAPSEVKK